MNFLSLVFNILCVFYTDSIYQFGLDIFQGLISPLWVVATILDSTDTEYLHHYRKSIGPHCFEDLMVSKTPMVYALNHSGG